MKGFTKNEVAAPGGPHDALYVEVGRRVRELRQRRAMTQQQLAALVSLTRASIANIEVGRQKVLLHTLFDLARALDATPTKLLPAAEDTAADQLGGLAEAYDGPGHEWVKKVTRRAAKGR